MRSSVRWGLGIGTLGLGLVMGCGPVPVVPDGGGDAPPSASCARASDCDDALFCTGVEACSPGAATADARGCVPGAPPCDAATCSESLDRCASGCDEPDVDGDGRDATACGGDDCADDDPNRYPGNAEVCDAADHDEDCDPATFGERDVDGDGEVDAACCNASATGMTCGSDCDDLRRSTNPSSPEVCDGLDNDCDAGLDEGLLLDLFRDADFDGVGGTSRELSCPGTPGFVAIDGDCDDGSPASRPNGPEICDAIDNDCDGAVDEASLAVPWYVDADGDGWGTVSGASPSMDSCAPLAGRAIRVGDCDDMDPMASPSAAERCNARDDDCNGLLDFEIAAGDLEDDDADGAPDALCGAPDEDCDDLDPFAGTPSAPEICDLRDNDCDGTADEGTAAVPWYADLDGDRWGDTASAISSCEILAGRVLRGGDCDDRVASTRPDGVDACSGSPSIDDDCDGTVDEGGVALTFFPDLDGDGFGTGDAIVACLADARTSTTGGDCDDADAAVSPAAIDDCASRTGVDDDCDGRVDETTTPRTYYADGDADGFGAGAPMSGCLQPAGTSITNDDCDDADRTRSPGVPDDCGTRVGIDDDCDASIDEAVAPRTFYLDADRDGFGAGSAMQACAIPAGAVLLDGDCDDASAARNPGAPDDCSRTDLVDDDCDGAIDEAATRTSYYRDADGDSYGAGAPVSACFAPSGHVARAGDCDDGSVLRSPIIPDDCAHASLVDDDCDGRVDEAAMLSSFYRDTDGDGYGAGTAIAACTAPVNHVSDPGDCDETNALRSPGRLDGCSTVLGVDDDCDTRIDEAATGILPFYRDVDGDGYGSGAMVPACTAPGGHVLLPGDCDEASVARHPGRADDCSGAAAVDDDCDTRIDEAAAPTAWYSDGDGDGYGTGAASMACTRPTGFAALSGDCADTNANRNPGRADNCATSLTVDDDCDGAVDEAVVLSTFYRDADADTFGTPLTTASACTPPAGYVATSTDCDDTRAAVRPSGSEVCGDGLDNECDGLTDCAEAACVATCGTVELVSGFPLTGAVHAPIATPLVVRVRDGLGMPLAARGVTVLTTSVTGAPGLTGITDAAGLATLSLRAGLPVGVPETLRITSNGMTEVTTTSTSTAPAAGTIFSLINGNRTTTMTGYPGPAFSAGLAALAMGRITSMPDGTVFVTANTQIVRVSPLGAASIFAGGGATPLADGVLATSAYLGPSSLVLSYDPVSNRVIFGSNTAPCVIWGIHVGTGLVSRVAGTGTCGRTGDGGSALAANIGYVHDISVTPTGLVYFIQHTTSGNSSGTAVRLIDAGGAIQAVIDEGSASGGVNLYAANPGMIELEAIPGSNDVYLGCQIALGPAFAILRVTPAGGLTLVMGGGSDTTATQTNPLMVRFSDLNVRLASDGARLFVGEGTGSRIRVLTGGTVSMVAGTSFMSGDTGDGGPALSARLQIPHAMTMFLGHVAFYDHTSRAVRVVW